MGEEGSRRLLPSVPTSSSSTSLIILAPKPVSLIKSFRLVDFWTLLNCGIWPGYYLFEPVSSSARMDENRPPYYFLYVICFINCKAPRAGGATIVHPVSVWPERT